MASLSSTTTCSWQQECLNLIASDATLYHYESTVAKQPYDIDSWVVYFDTLEERLLTTVPSTNKTKKADEPTAINVKIKQQQKYYQLRDLVGRRALTFLPKSYKLWKLQWEFVLQWEKQQQNDDSNERNPAQNLLLFHKAMARAVWTLHAYPRVWMVWLEWLRAHPHVISTSRLRHIVNRALQAVPVTQHDKLWPVILSIYYNDSDNHDSKDHDAAQTTTDANRDAEENPDTAITAASALPHWNLPLESRVRILKRYAEYYPPFQTELADWLLSRAAAEGTDGNRASTAAGPAALLYQTALNQRPSPLTPSQRQEAWMAFLQVGSQFPKAVMVDAGIPWERIVRGALTQLQQQQQQRRRGQKGVPARDEDDAAGRWLSELMNQEETDSNNNHTSETAQLEGWLWTQLADSWIRQGQFDAARSVYEEGLQRVHKVRDFSILYDAYLQLEEGLLTAATNQLEEQAENEVDDDMENDKVADENDWDILVPESTTTTTATKSSSLLADMEWAMARAEHLTKRRPLLLNQVMLRQNPHNVAEWLTRADLYVQAQQPQMAASALEDGLKIVQATQAVNGTPSAMVVKLVNIYAQELQNVAAARDLLDRICHQEVYRFRTADDLAECWVAWIELELGQDAWEDALSLARQSVASGSSRYVNLTKSLRLWDLVLDLEESLGTVQTTKDMYNRAIDIKVATVQHILNYASFLADQKYFEQSFSAYERGIELFAFPHVGAKLLWKAYLEAFEKRYKGSKIERMRDLFQRCLENCPTEECSEFFIMNGKFEEDYGLAKRALSVYRSMCQKVPREEKLTAYLLFIAKTTKYLGLTATREIYQEAIENLPDQDSAKLCLEFCAMETSLDQPERARAILTYGAQMADPRRMPEYWRAWNEFEIAHGNEETFREMLRVKRSVEAAFSTVNYNAIGMSENVENLTNEEAMSMIAAQEGVELDQPMTGVKGFVPGKRTAPAAALDDIEERVAKLRKTSRAGNGSAEIDEDNGDEIDIDDIDAEIEAAAAEGAAAAESNQDSNKKDSASAASIKDVSTRIVPAGVFGDLAAEPKESTGVTSQGALERLRAAAKSK